MGTCLQTHNEFTEYTVFNYHTSEALTVVYEIFAKWLMKLMKGEVIEHTKYESESDRARVIEHKCALSPYVLPPPTHTDTHTHTHVIVFTNLVQYFQITFFSASVIQFCVFHFQHFSNKGGPQFKSNSKF